MAYYSSPKKYEDATGKRFTTKCSCIHVSGSVRGMVELGFWDKPSDSTERINDEIHKDSRKIDKKKTQGMKYLVCT